MSPIRWKSLSEFGAFVDVDPSDDLRSSVIEELVELYHEHRLLLFRSQRLSGVRQRQVSKWFGPLLRDDDVDGFVSVDPQRGALGVSRLAYHSDLSWTPHPLLGLSLYAVEVTDGATSTLCSGNEARAELKQPAKRLK